MHLNKKGQGMAIDLLFAVIIFLLILGASMALINSNTTTLVDKNILRELQERAIQTTDMLVRTQGQPNNWEDLGTIDEIGVIGLAKRDRVLDEAKVDKFVQLIANYSDTTGDYNKVKSLLLIGYDYYFKMTDSSGTTIVLYDGTGEPVKSGIPPDDRWDNMTAMRVKRIVNFEGEAAIVEFTIYYPR